MKIFYYLCVVFTNICLAAPFTCPDVAAIKSGQVIWPKGPWLPEYTINHELAFAEDVQRFQAQIDSFAKAQWNAHYLEMGHCHYHGHSTIVLANQMLRPCDALYPQWIFNPHRDEAFCYSDDVEHCPFSGRG